MLGLDPDDAIRSDEDLDQSHERSESDKAEDKPVESDKPLTKREQKLADKLAALG